ncbi:undecaprenyldiphospho-muramoylpentapeptide beta-N-acetylglucosaminyltransferase [Paenibacillus yanchengensis]|uniref:UDP-N-acetylglucosamine--N-acetylmuramyl-(pentapeptide) pyrophosphoryl-undecaprenol N-acetylglucosamine transferase n=1 Tax=Paenibacillus yanchengensis TaxID=2035833 RepID=A0ABW4YKG9_9BACL
MRIVLTGGGTGGHIYPALAIGKYMRQQHQQTELLYIGTERGLESKIVPDSNIPFEAIEITGFRRSISVENVKTVIRFLKGTQRAKQLLKQFRAEVVVGTGGYVCGPVVYAAAKLGIPTFIHEQNAIPGLTNKFLSQYASAVGISFEQSSSLFPKAKQVSLTGNPCATNVLETRAGEGLKQLSLPRDAEMVIMVGGSRGAKAFNDALLEMAEYLPKLAPLTFVFITGELYYESTLAKLQAMGVRQSKNLIVLPYAHQMPALLRDAKLVISRSGASSLAEMTALGLPSILIPSPNVTNNHQEANARTLVDAGAAELILEKELSGKKLYATIERIFTNKDRLSQMSEAARKLAVPDAALRIDQILQAIKR